MPSEVVRTQMLIVVSSPALDHQKHKQFLGIEMIIPIPLRNKNAANIRLLIGHVLQTKQFINLPQLIFPKSGVLVCFLIRPCINSNILSPKTMG